MSFFQFHLLLLLLLLLLYIDYYYFVVNTHYKRDVQLFFTIFFHNMIKWQVMIRATSFWHELIIDITCKKIKIIKIMNLVPCLLKAWARARHCSWKNAGTTNYTFFCHNSSHSKLWVEKKKKKKKGDESMWIHPSVTHNSPHREEP